MTEPPDRLLPTTASELEQALSHALRFDGRKSFKPSGELMAKITAGHLVECLRVSGFVILKKPPGPQSSIAAMPSHLIDAPEKTGTLHNRSNVLPGDGIGDAFKSAP